MKTWSMHNSLMPDKDGVAEAFELSWEQLDENAKSFGCLLSLCALADIPLSIGTVEDDKKQELWEKAIADLLKLHLLQQKNQGIYHLNPTIRQLFQMKLEESGEANEAKTKFAAMMLEVAKLIPQQLTPEDIVNFTPHIPHITEVATHLSQYVSDEELHYSIYQISLVLSRSRTLSASRTLVAAVCRTN